MSWKDVFPQSVGILPFPFAILLLPSVKEEELEKILKLDFSKVPSELKFFKEIYEGNLDRAKELIQCISDKELSNYLNTFIEFMEKRDKKVLHNFSGSSVLKKLLLLLDMEEVLNVQLNEREDFYTLSHYAKAKFLEKRIPKEALRHIDEALRHFSFNSPVFKANILLTKANIIYKEKGSSYHLIQLYKEILELIKDTEAKEIRGEVHFQLGNLFSQFGNIKEAVSHYREALDVFTKDKNPYMYALVNNNLGLTYLSVQSYDIDSQVRLALGVQHLKKALEVFTKEDFPEEWASATLNYANALIYLPTANPLKNLTKALELYREVLAYRKGTGNTEGYARVLANMGNLLAHLGRFDEAREKLKDAKKLFISLNLLEEAQAVEEILREIALAEARNGE